MIVFVCTGNTCRSPMAKALYEKMAGEKAESFGLMCAEGRPASRFAVSAMARLGIDIGAHISRRITKESVSEADEVLCMTEEQKIMLIYAYPEFADKIHLLSEAAGKNGNVSDPYGGDERTYRLCAEKIEELIDGYIKKHTGRHPENQGN